MENSLECQAMTALSPRKFHRIFKVPATVTHGPLNVTYSIAGVEKGEDIPTILFCGGMFGTRYQAYSLDWMATRDGVRVLFVDRPAFGGSTPVELPQRITTFLEVIPLLLDHLGIKYISIASHSAGTIYGLNLLSRRPDLLNPSNPRVTLFSPWVHQSHTSVSFLRLASMLPNVFLNYWNSVVGFMINDAQPAFAGSSGVITSVASSFQTKPKSPKKEKEVARKCLQGFGISKELKDEVDKLSFKYSFEENTKGANEEARLCLKSIPGTGWDACEDYDQCVQNLARYWGSRVEDGEPKLLVSIVLPEEDMMVGEKGKEYFQTRWSKEICGQGINVEVLTLEGTDHETTSLPSEGAIGRMFCEVQRIR